MRGLMLTRWRGCCRLSGGDGSRSFSVSGNPGGSISHSILSAVRQSPHSGALFAFRGKRGHLVKLLWYDGQGMCLFSKRLDRGHFIWPMTQTGRVALTSAQLAMLLEGIDWRRP
jgi:transposase